MTFSYHNAIKCHRQLHLETQIFSLKIFFFQEPALHAPYINKKLKHVYLWIITTFEIKMLDIKNIEMGFFEC